ncbi:MAG: penicillin-binding transpeptidase domain-containing protein [Bacillota bacterium]
MKEGGIVLGDIFKLVFTMSMVSIATFLLVLAAKRIFRYKLSAAWHYCIWLVLLITLVIPFTPKLSFNIELPVWIYSRSSETESISEVGLVETAGATSERLELNKRLEQENHSAKADENNTAFQHMVKGWYEESIVHNLISSSDFYRISGIIWISGMAMIAVFVLFMRIRLTRKIAKHRLNIESTVINSILGECKSILSINKSIELIFQDHIKSPAFYGMLKPKLLLPISIIEALDAEEIRFVILHELCHYKRKDTIVSTIQLLLNVIHWFNPFMWYASTLISEDREIACDSSVISRINSLERRRYSETLLKMLETFSESLRYPSLASLSNGRLSGLERRLKLINAVRKRPIVITICITLIVLLISLSLTGAIRSQLTAAEANDKALPAVVSSDFVGGMIYDRNGLPLYPNGSLAAHIIGYRDETGVGVFGVERLLDSYGRDEYSITLTIDKNIQQMAETALKNAMETHKAAGGAVVMIDAYTGEVLAMTSMPSFDISAPFKMPESMDPSTWNEMTKEDQTSYINKNILKNKAISAYEPASTFKSITAAALLEEGIVRRDTQVSDDGPLEVDGRKLSCWRGENPHGLQSFEEAIYNSCNTVIAEKALELGEEKLYDYIRRFGLYYKSDMGLVEEEDSMFIKDPGKLELALNSIGQGLRITPLQLAAAYGAIANGGNYISPRIVQQIKEKDSVSIDGGGPVMVYNVISKETSAILRNILEGVVSEGTAKAAYIEGYRIAGKTGTIQKVETGTYKNKYIASFAGFAPADDPQIVCVMLLDEPQGEYLGGLTAAPASSKLMKEVLDYLKNN